MKKEIQAIKTLLPLLRIYPWAIPAMISLSMLASLSDGFGISLFIPFLQTLQQEQSQTLSGNSFIDSLMKIFAAVPDSYRVLIIPLCILVSILIKNLIVYSNAILFAWLNSRISNRLRCQIFNQILTVSYSFLERSESGKMMNILATESWQTSKALNIFVNLISNASTIIVLATLLLLISWRLTLIISISLFLISQFIHFVTHRVKQLAQQAVEANSTLAVRMWEGLGGMRAIRSFGREPYEQERFDRASEYVRNTFLQLDVLGGIINPLYEVLSAVLLLVILGISLLQNQSAMPTLLTFLFILYRLQPQVQQLDVARVGLISTASSAQLVMSFLETADKPYIVSGNVPFDKLKQAIYFESVSLTYNPEDQPAIQDVSIEFKRGQTTALVGPSGAGKSSIISLLCRFYEPTSGGIYIDNSPLQELNLKDWRREIAIVSQEVHIFSGTVKDNIAYGRLEATEAEIFEAAKLANAHNFISQLPEGYDTKVGDRGVRLSGGQRQRIALARAIVRDPDILILDEATNALDSIAENLIQEALNTLRQNRTVIVIAHRLSTIENADKIIVMENGRAIEQGNLQYLLELDGLFAKLYHLQHRHIQN
ncbi:ABC transporter ATP-binding protein [Microcoleus sp.]|uniref:ABC transporter ATP-binding protein n=1 Tax=Microcoleus sp. TaxID=44472 RepID=UPI0035945F74